MTKPKRKIMDIAAPPAYFKTASFSRPKTMAPMADIIRPTAGNKSAEDFSLFFFSLGRLLIPRLLPKLLALFLCASLIAMPIWPVLAEELLEQTPTSILPFNKEEEEGDGILPLEKEEEEEEKGGGSLPSLEKEDEDKFEEKRNEETPTSILPLREREEEGGRENDSGSEVRMTENPSQPLFDKGRSEEGKDILPLLEEEEKKEEQKDIPLLEKESVGGFEEEKSEEKEESEEFAEDNLYEKIRRDLDSEWRARIEEYQKKLEAKETELQNQKNLWEKSLNQLVQEEIKKELNQKCLKLGEVDYYCLADKNDERENDSKAAANLNENLSLPKEIFSLKDSQKNNREIYLKENGTLHQLTDNNFDDIFPALDIVSNLATWQSLIGGFWQLFVYNLTTNELKQLTESQFNNMNPQIQNGRIVWQGWQDNNWEIFLAERKNENCFLENDCWLTRRLTQNSQHDMFPKIAGDLITWQIFENNIWQLMVYNLKTNSLSRLTQGENKAENPRFVILWESRQAGLKKYFTYDLSSGELLEIKPGSPTDPDGEKLPSLPLAENAIAAPATTSPARSDDATSSPEESE